MERDIYTLLNDNDWSIVDGEPCRVIDFNLSGLNPNSVFYASVVFECKRFPKQFVGYIAHMLDYRHLYEALNKRRVRKNEEAIFFWTKRNYKSYAKILSHFMPRLWVMIYAKGAFELLSDPNFKPELHGEARWNAEKPIIDWKPRVMK